MSELATWLLEQIDYDDAVSRLSGSAFGGEWSQDRRRIVGQCENWLTYDPDLPAVGRRASFPEAADVILRLLAVPYADRTGYLPRWRPA